MANLDPVDVARELVRTIVDWAKSDPTGRAWWDLPTKQWTRSLCVRLAEWGEEKTGLWQADEFDTATEGHPDDYGKEEYWQIDQLWFRKGPQWPRWDYPAVAMEHEWEPDSLGGQESKAMFGFPEPSGRKYRFAKAFYQYWRLACLRANLRILISYTERLDLVDTAVKDLERHLPKDLPEGDDIILFFEDRDPRTGEWWYDNRRVWVGRGVPKVFQRI
ncbi:MAG: hypothetical protein HYZ53_15085 [Planctomycetes bacterium]|nr:hypothetical protein [Planctomycetota bacterium]